MRNFKTILLIVVLAFAAFGFKCNKNGGSNNEPIITVYSQTQQRTPKGALVASLSGVRPEFLEAVDEELTEVFRDVAGRNYTSAISHSEYVIYALHNCVLSPESQTRSFLIRADAYDGTIYDQDPRPGIGKIYAAEMVLADGNAIRTQYIVCDTPQVDGDLRDALRYGPEHILLYFNDRAEFDRTWFHGNGISHPLIRSVNGERRDSRQNVEKRDVVDFGGFVRKAK